MWRLQLFGRFELRDPHGEVVTLPTRKAQGALAILALSPSHSASRIELQTALWPQALPSRQQTNLRQALSQLRRALPDGAIIATRDRCRLSDLFEFACDALEFNPLRPIEGGQEPILLPDLTEAWFEQRRRKYMSHRSPEAGGLSASYVPLDGFLQLLRWCTEYDPRRALDLLRANRDIALGIPPRELLPLVERSLGGCSPDDPLFGWGLYWRGVCVFVSHDVVSAEPWLQKAVSLAISHGDRALQIASLSIHIFKSKFKFSFTFKDEETVTQMHGMVDLPLIKANW